MRPHAVAGITGTVNGIVNPVYSYDANGNMLDGAGRSLTYTSYNLPSSMVRGTASETFIYDADHVRVQKTESGGNVYAYLNPRFDLGAHYEKVTKPNGTVEYEHYLYAGGRAIGRYKETVSGATTTTEVVYFLLDHLGSISVIVNSGGGVAERLSYDAWGKRRNTNGSDNPSITGTYTEHGYTGHEMLDDVGLIHMNGRVYDPLLGKFTTPDSYIQSPENSQSYNRYAYVINNPMSATDPSGHFWGFAIAIFSIMAAGELHIIDRGTARALMGIATAAYLGPTGGGFSLANLGQAAVAGFASGIVTTGNLDGGFRSGLSAMMFYGAGGSLPGAAGAGCASAMMSGGDCATGALTAGVAQFGGDSLKVGRLKQNLLPVLYWGAPSLRLVGESLQMEQGRLLSSVCSMRQRVIMNARWGGQRMGCRGRIGKGKHFTVPTPQQVVNDLLINRWVSSA